MGSVHRGMYGQWRVEEADLQEVALYRSGLAASAACATVGAGIFLLGGGEPDASARAALDPLFFGGAAGLGLALALVHMYLGDIKKVMQALWIAGLAGSAVVKLVEPGQSVVDTVASQPLGVWAVGPLFAALTGLAFKEGACYGKPEAWGLFFLTPVALLGHLTGLAGDGPEEALLLASVACYSVFAFRKFSQPPVDDLGDKSVFEFMQLSEAEQALAVAQLERNKAAGGSGQGDCM